MGVPIRGRILHCLQNREELATAEDIAAEIEAPVYRVRSWLEKMHSDGEVSRTFVGLYGPMPKKGTGAR